MFKKFTMVFVVMITCVFYMTDTPQAIGPNDIIVFMACNGATQQNYHRQCTHDNFTVEGSMVLYGNDKGIIIGKNGQRTHFDVSLVNGMIMINTGQQQAVYRPVENKYLMSVTHGNEPIRMHTDKYNKQMFEYIK